MIGRFQTRLLRPSQLGLPWLISGTTQASIEPAHSGVEKISGFKHWVTLAAIFKTSYD